MLDDVNLRKRGWVNRNRILVQGAPHYITCPLEHASQNRRISEHRLASGGRWREKLLKTIHHSYRRAPFFRSVFPVVESVILLDDDNLASYVVNGIVTVCRYLRLDTEIEASSRRYENANLKGQKRILDICLRSAASDYLNPASGADLYDQTLFSRSGVRVHFLQSRSRPYPQFAATFQPDLSIIDVLMFNAPWQIDDLLSQYDLAHIAR